MPESSASRCIRFAARRLWWRDDDFTDYFSRFDALQRTAERLGARPLIAAIPGAMRPDFRLRDTIFRFAVHGWKHVNHGCSDQQKSEYGRLRAPDGVYDELRAARTAAQGHFGACLENWFVPPFNRITEPHLDALRAAGFEALSASGDERPWVAQLPSLKLPFVCIDLWCDANHRVKTPQAVGAELLQVLRHRSAATPLGLMTHHKRFKPTDWERFVAVVDHLRVQGWSLADCDARFCADFPHPPRLEGWTLRQCPRVSWR